MSEIFGNITATPLSFDAINKNITDQTFNPESKNAQSGKAVAEATHVINDMRLRNISANAFNWEIGSLYNGGNMDSTNRLRTDYIWLEKGSVIKSPNNLILLHCCDIDKQFISATAWKSGTITVENTGYARILLAFSDNSTVTEENKTTLIDGTTICLQFGDISKDAVDTLMGVEKTFTADDILSGTLVSGEYQPNPSRVYIQDYIAVTKGDVIDFDNSKSNSATYVMLVVYYDNNKNFVSQTTWKPESVLINKDGYIRILIGTKGYTAITDDFSIIASMVKYTSNVKNATLIVNRECANINSRVDEMAKSIITFANENDAKVAEFASLYQNTEKVDSFLYFTDPHLLSAGDTTKFYDKFVNYTEVLGEFYNRTPTTFVLCGGDWLEWNDTPENALYKLSIMTGQMKKLFGENYYPAFGNHDDNYGGDNTNGDPKLNNSVLKNVMFPFQNDMYYRFEGQIGSFYVLNSGTDQRNPMDDYRWEQIDWLANDLKTTDKPYSAIAMHIIWNIQAAHTLNDDITPFATNVNAVIEAYNNRNSVTLNGITYNFTDCTGRVCFMLGGHGHIDHIDTENYAVPMILTTAMYYGTSPTFEMVLVDWENGTLNMVRVGDGGNGENRTIDISGITA